MYSETNVELSGLFHGYTNMVLSFLHYIWWTVWSSAPPWWGKPTCLQCDSCHFVQLGVAVYRLKCSFAIQIRTLGMLRGRFHTLPAAFNASLIPHSMKDEKRRKQRGFFPFNFCRVRDRSRVYAERLNCIFEICIKKYPFFPFQGSDGQKNSMAKFVLVWNQVINSFRTEDLISNK